MRPLMAAAPMLRAPRPEMTPESASRSWACAAAGPPAVMMRMPASVSNWNRISVLPKLFVRGRGRLRRREAEHRAVERRVGIGLVELDFLAVRGALGARNLLEGEVDARHLLVVAVIGDRLHGYAVPDAAVDGADIEEVVRVEVHEGDVAVGPRHAQLLGIGAVDVLGAEIIELVPLGLVVDQGAGEVRG